MRLQAAILLLFVLPEPRLLAQTDDRLQFVPLFNGKNLDGWVDVNTSKETWKVKNGTLICSGKPIGVMRSDRQYENFILEVEWKHMEAGGNSGVFIWSEGTPQEHDPLTKAIEVQMLELDYARQHQATIARFGRFPARNAALGRESTAEEAAFLRAD